MQPGMGHVDVHILWSQTCTGFAERDLGLHNYNQCLLHVASPRFVRPEMLTSTQQQHA